jgi:hypothetical protein
VRFALTYGPSTRQTCRDAILIPGERSLTDSAVTENVALHNFYLTAIRLLDDVETESDRQ